jgi:SAM-dependent methyltransferase
VGRGRVDRTRETYDRIAADYRDRRRDRTAVMVHIEALAARLEPRSLLLDVGCGPGFDSAEFRARGHRVIGMDRSWGMLQSGLRNWPGPRAQVDMRELPVRAGVDALWVSASMLHVEREDVPRTLAGFRRALATGGWLYVSLKGGEGAAWDDRYGSDTPRWFTYWSEEAIDEVLAAAGFEVAERFADPLPDRRGEQQWIIRIARAVESAQEER